MPCGNDLHSLERFGPMPIMPVSGLRLCTHANKIHTDIRTVRSCSALYDCQCKRPTWMQDSVPIAGTKNVCHKHWDTLSTDLTTQREPLRNNTLEPGRCETLSGEFQNNGQRLWNHAINAAASAWAHSRSHRSSTTADTPWSFRADCLQTTLSVLSSSCYRVGTCYVPKACLGRLPTLKQFSSLISGPIINRRVT